MGIVDGLVIFAYTCLMVGVGAFYARRNRTADDYLLGGRKISPIALGLSLFAALVSTLSYLGNPGEMIAHGPIGHAGGAEPSATDVRLFEETKAKAEMGEVDAQYKLAGLYGKGVGTAKDDAAAVEWYRKVAERNDRRGQSMLGVMYTNARGVPRDYDRAIELFRKAAAQNSAHAQYNLGHMYATGKGVPKNDEESAAWYRKAAEQSDVNSQRILGSLYADGRGVPRDLVQAYTWTKVTSTPENPTASQQLRKYAEQMTAEQIAAAEKAADEIQASIHQRRNQ